jgi:RNA polymerase-binding transcription factor DksA
MTSRRPSVPARIVSEFRRRLAATREFLHGTPATSSSLLGRRERRELKAAEARLDAGVFGLCEACGRPIALGRLRAAPTTRYCTRCAPKTTRR